nr:stalk domain-containing protein [Paenibacillus shirakamiensis]
MPASSVQAAQPVAVQQLKQVYRIVALGDSVSAGYEPSFRTEANPKPYGYVERLNEQGLFRGRTQTSNYGILGLTTEGLRNYIGAVKEGRTLTPDSIQLGLLDPRIAQFGTGTLTAKADLQAANVITLSIGGNDVTPLMKSLTNLSLSEVEADTQLKQLLANYAVNLRQVLNDLTIINPQALIVIADQYQPVPQLAGAAAYLKLEKAASDFSACVDSLVAEFAAKGANIKAAHIAKAFVGNEISYTHIFSDTDIHPNQMGYEVIAKVFSDIIWGSSKKLAQREDPAQIAVVVSGNELNSPYHPTVKNGQTFLPIKDIVSAIGATSVWDTRSNTASISYGSRKVSITIGSKTVLINGVKIPTASPAYLAKFGKETKTFVPLALLAQGLGLDVQYSSKLNTAFINL